jgi:hypothetical protein
LTNPERDGFGTPGSVHRRYRHRVSELIAMRDVVFFNTANYRR